MIGVIIEKIDCTQYNDTKSKGGLIMKCAVRYYTKTGNTKRLAEAIANVVGVDALPISEPITEQVDILFLGN